jgi:uncharacterized protein (TIGR02284 family)
MITMNSATMDAPGTKKDTSKLNSLLRGELSAVETYDQAITKFEEKNDSATLTELRRIRNEHNEAVDALRSRILELGGEPEEGSGAWGVFTAAVTGTAKVLGPQTTLSALHKGEEHGVKSYEDAIKSGELSSECTMIVRNEHARCKGHMDVLNRMIDTLKANEKK